MRYKKFNIKSRMFEEFNSGKLHSLIFMLIFDNILFYFILFTLYIT